VTRPAVRVRPAGEGDLDAVVALFASVAAEGRWIAGEAPIDLPRRRARFAAALQRPDMVMLVAEGRTGEGSARLVGQLAIELTGYGVGELGMLVAADWRRRGVGGALLAAGLAVGAGLRRRPRPRSGSAAALSAAAQSAGVSLHGSGRRQAGRYRLISGAPADQPGSPSCCSR
jgi:GNAT superfamily N-acetyltransferase